MWAQPGVGGVEGWVAPSAFFSQSLRLRSKSRNGKHLGAAAGREPGGRARDGAAHGGPGSPSLPLLMLRLLQAFCWTPWAWAGAEAEVGKEAQMGHGAWAPRDPLSQSAGCVGAHSMEASREGPMCQSHNQARSWLSPGFPTESWGRMGVGAPLERVRGGEG